MATTRCSLGRRASDLNVGTHHAGTLEEADLICKPELLHFCNFPRAAALGKLPFQQQGGSVAPNWADSGPEEIFEQPLQTVLCRYKPRV